MTALHLPNPDAETVPYWEAARDGRLLIKRCTACGRPHFYPRPFCPHCWSDAVEWEEASGRATIYTFSIVRRNDLPPWGERVPYVAAVVDLEEGPRMITNIVDCDVDVVAIGQSVEVAFRDEDEFVIPVFRLAAS
ncbi:MAG: Zn-ribbon domain-containing OB-fold protein [Actinomycetota bacterium]|nr:Zn-ribbon domain-containing OB-fold protein [Acidimicrobiia bacterium]MDQ3294561.1 Zn-ribbon domain-containing OB-fold protein [Actinomycetota bacterium]